MGRQREQADLAELVGSSPLVVVTGPSGIGKTRLCLRVAGRLASTFADGAWVVELALVPATDDPALVADAVATALDVRPEPNRSLLEALAARLQNTSLLLVLDNCEHLSAAATAVVSKLLNTCPALRVLATSQHPLGVPGERVWPLAPLSLPGPGSSGAGSDAVALFHARAKAVQPSFVVNDEGATAVGEICRRLDGIPLALELAAARTAVLTPTEIAEHLDQRFNLLKSPGAHGSSRHQTLQSALDWSFDLLDPAEKALLRRLSVFAAGAGLKQVRDICTGGEVHSGAVLDLLSALVSKSLVDADTGGSRARYRLLETVRVYARARLDECGETDDVARRHAHWFCDFGERGWQEVVTVDHRGGADTLELEHDNLRAALGWLLDHHEAEMALRLGSALTPFWKRRGHFREGREWLEKAVVESADISGVAPALRIRALWAAGMLATMQGDLERAAPALEEALALAREHGHQRAAVQALNLLGFIRVFTSSPLTALPLLEESVALARDDGDGASLISTLALYGRARLFSGDTAAAEAAFSECRKIGQSMGDGDDSDGLIGLGWVAMLRGHHGEAQQLLAEALPLVRNVDERFETALVLSFLGELAWRRGDDKAAYSHLDEGLGLARSMGAPYLLARCLMGLCRAKLAAGDLASSALMGDEAVTAARQARFAYVLVRCLHARAEVYVDAGDFGAAQAAIDEALEIATANNDKAGMADSLRASAGLVGRRDEYVRAITLYLSALSLYVETGDEGGVSAVLEGQAAVALGQGRAAHATRMLGSAGSLRRSCGSVRSPAEATVCAELEARLRAQLPAKEFDDAWAQGAALSFDDALGLATRSRGGRRRPGSGVTALTATERQVTDLVADGLTNGEIAERMFLSPRTVQGHVSRVFGKLGLSTRRELRDEWRRRTEAGD